MAGPLRLRYGAPRDLLIGITMVRADGTVALLGGRGKVVKNVAVVRHRQAGWPAFATARWG